MMKTNFLYLPDSNQCINLAHVAVIGINNHPLFRKVDPAKPPLTFSEGAKRGMTLQEIHAAAKQPIPAPQPEQIGEETEAYLILASGDLRKFKKPEDVAAIVALARSIAPSPRKQTKTLK